MSLQFWDVPLDSVVPPLGAREDTLRNSFGAQWAGWPWRKPQALEQTAWVWNSIRLLICCEFRPTKSLRHFHYFFKWGKSYGFDSKDWYDNKTSQFKRVRTMTSILQTLADFDLNRSPEREGYRFGDWGHCRGMIIYSHWWTRIKWTSGPGTGRGRCRVRGRCGVQQERSKRLMRQTEQVPRLFQGCPAPVLLKSQVALSRSLWEMLPRLPFIGISMTVERESLAKVGKALSFHWIQMWNTKQDKWQDKNKVSRESELYFSLTLSPISHSKRCPVLYFML